MLTALHTTQTPYTPHKDKRQTHTAKTRAQKHTHVLMHTHTHTTHTQVH